MSTPGTESIVVFLDRKAGKLVPFTEVPEVIFPEIMRDVDLVVSVAHVGGVDPVASLSHSAKIATVISVDLWKTAQAKRRQGKVSRAPGEEAQEAYYDYQKNAINKAVCSHVDWDAVGAHYTGGPG